MPEEKSPPANNTKSGARSLFHLDYPTRSPGSLEFPVAGWVAGSLPLQAVRVRYLPDQPLELVPRPDVQRMMAQFPHVSGFRGLIRGLSPHQDLCLQFLMGDVWVEKVFLGGEVQDVTNRKLLHRVNELERALAALTASVDLLKSKTELPLDGWKRLQSLRREASPSPEPLVSVCIATHNRVDLLTRRSLPSVLNQSYRNLEVIVVADGCTDATAAAVRALGDSRVRLHEIERDPVGLDDVDRRWMVSGSRPMNAGLALATGDYITHLDDDDEYVPDRIGKLVAFAASEEADLVYHPFHSESGQGDWLVNEAFELRVGQVTTSSIFYRNWIKNITWDLDTHLLSEPSDWNRVRRIIYSGAKCVRHPEPLLKHYRERNQALTAVQPPSQSGVDGMRAGKSHGQAGLVRLVGRFAFGLRHEWAQVMDELEATYGGGPVAMLSGVDWQLMSGEPFPNPWVGVFHQPFASFEPCVGLFDLKGALEKVGALKTCKGLYVLTDYQKRFLDESDIGVPVERLWHPTVFDVPQWSPDSWLADRRIVFLGRWIRRVQAIQELQCPGVRKLWLAKQSEPIAGVEENGSVQRLGYLEAGAYDELLTGCVAMTEVIEAAANNVVLECISRSTPLLINWNTGVVEYLGPDYPLYYSSMAEANWKAASVRQVLAAHEYLRRMDKSRFTLDRFVRDFGSGPICAQLGAER